VSAALRFMVMSMDESAGWTSPGPDSFKKRQPQPALALGTPLA
jgi:hypothetical protein